MGKDDGKPGKLDKTFGMKNKKGNKNQQMIAQQQKMQRGGDDDYEKQRLREKKAAEDALNMVLFTEAKKKNEIKRAAEAACAKKQEEKAPDKRNIYEDSREAKEADGMESWDEEKLRSVIEGKGGAGERVKSEIVCKHFLDAIEKKNYGWFWECPNGGDKCQYRHCLPAGYVLKTDAKEVEKKELLLEDIIEEKRKAVVTRTPVTLERLQTWLQAKKDRQAAEEDKKLEEAKEQYKKGKRPAISGRALFTIDPSLFVDDDAAGGVDFEKGGGDDGDDDDDDQRGAVDLTPMAAPDRPITYAPAPAPEEAPAPAPAGSSELDGVDESAFADEDEDEDEDAAGAAVGAGVGEASSSAQGEAAASGPPPAPDLEGVDESLFLGEDFDDAEVDID